MSNEFDISLIIAAWNAEATLARCLDSCLACTGHRLEIIVIDDCSTDKTMDVAHSYRAHHSNIVVLQTEKNGGPSRARNLGIAQANGEWIAVIDADDTIAPDRFAQIFAADAALKSDALFDNMNVVEHGKTRPFLSKKLPTIFSLKFFVDNNLSYESNPALGYLKPVIKKDFLIQHGLKYDENLLNSEDYLLIIEILAAGGVVGYRDHCGYNYFIDPQSISAAFKSSHNDRFIERERDFLTRRQNSLSPVEKSALETHIRYRMLSEGIHHLIQALKRKDILATMKLLSRQSLPDAATMIKIVGRILVLKALDRKSRV